MNQSNCVGWVEQCKTQPTGCVQSDRPLVAEATARARTIHNETVSLTLLNVVEGNNPNEAVGVLRATLLHFIQDFLRRSRTEQRQLPHRPVVGFSRRILVELDTGSEAVIENVLDLLQDLSIGQRRQIRKRLVTALFG